MKGSAFALPPSATNPNLLSYVTANPLLYIDPLGLFTDDSEEEPTEESTCAIRTCKTGEEQIGKNGKCPPRSTKYKEVKKEPGKPDATRFYCLKDCDILADCPPGAACRAANNVLKLPPKEIINVVCKCVKANTTPPTPEK
jgi:hypothetical protein